MSANKLRRRIAFEAARLMYSRQEKEYLRAKMKAARRLCSGQVKPYNLPSNREIRDQIQTFARVHEGDQRTENLRDMRIEALRLMKLLRPFRPRLVGSTLTGHVRQGSDIDLHAFSDHLAPVLDALDDAGIPCETERKEVVKDGRRQTFTHIRIEARFPVEITVYPGRQVNRVPRSSITGKPMERASIAELERLLSREYPELVLDHVLEQETAFVDRFSVYRSLLVPLESVRQNPEYHPEGDALYHSLQVFELARDELPYDEEFLLAALLHDVGKAIDPRDHTAAGLEALGDSITPRTRWLIEHHTQAQQALDGTLGARSRRRLQADENYEELKLLAECDREGREIGVRTCDVEDALDYIRDLGERFGT